MYPDSTLLGPSKSGPVYRATHPGTLQAVLVKLLPWDGAAPSALNTETVEQLAPQLTQLMGFNIASLLGIEKWDTGLGVVSEFFAGPTVSQHPEKGTISAKAVLDIANQLINALCDGERMRLIHGDIKPSNVIVGTQPDGRPHVKLTDWGLNQARANQPAETLLFTAPERLGGMGPSLRGDLFSLGHVLFFLLTGMTLVKGRNAQEIATGWETAAPEHLKKIRKDLPPKFVKFLLTLLEQNPEKRPANPSAARSLIAELSPPPLPMAQTQSPPRAAAGAAPRQPTRPLSAPTVVVQAPLRPLGSNPAPATTANVPATTPVPVVAMRPPPEIAAKLNLPMEPIPIPIAPAGPPPGSYTQPFVTGATAAVPSGVRTQPIAQHQATPAPSRHGQLSQSRAMNVQPVKSRGPLFLILTLVVLASMGVTGYFVWKNKTDANAKEQPTEVKTESNEDLKAKIRGGK